MLGRLQHQAAQLGFRSGEGGAIAPINAHIHRHAVRRMHHVAADMDFMPQPASQKAVKFAQRNPGFGNFNLDVVAPAAGKRPPRPGLQAVGFFHHVELVQQLCRQHFAGIALCRKVGRHRETVQHQPVAAGGVPDHEAQPRHHRHGQQSDGGFKRCPGPIAEAAKTVMRKLEAIFPLHLLHLQMQHAALIV